jgi:hypothetical protein
MKIALLPVVFSAISVRAFLPTRPSPATQYFRYGPRLATASLSQAAGAAVSKAPYSTKFAKPLV